MNQEKRLLHACIDSRAGYQQIVHLATEEDFSVHGWILFETIRDYYEYDELCSEVSLSHVQDYLRRTHPRHEETFKQLLDGEGEKISPPNVAQEFIAMKLSAINLTLAHAILDGSGQDEIDNIIEQRAQCEMVEQDSDNSIQICPSIDDIIEDILPENIISVRPAGLAMRLGGGYVPGNQIAIYAPKEVGKSLVSIDQAAGFIQDGRKVLYYENEDPVKTTTLRFISNLTHLNRDEILADRRGAYDLALSRGFANLIMKSATPGTIPELRRDIEIHSPEIVVINQLANMECSKTFSKVEKLEWLASQTRTLAKKFNIVSILVHQAGERAYGKQILDKNDMYFSNVGLQAAQDIMLGIGMTADDLRENRRWMNITVNKNTGRLDVFPFTVDTTTSRIIE